MKICYANLCTSIFNEYKEFAYSRRRDGSCEKYRYWCEQRRAGARAFALLFRDVFFTFSIYLCPESSRCRQCERQKTKRRRKYSTNIFRTNTNLWRGFTHFYHICAVWSEVEWSGVSEWEMRTVKNFIYLSFIWIGIWIRTVILETESDGAMIGVGKPFHVLLFSVLLLSWLIHAKMHVLCSMAMPFIDRKSGQ